tara:strand:+ start:51 stop:272 length:222 start_codon:yes stop_codon:yes gene_type:complete
MKVIAKGVDARGQPYKLIREKEGCKYLWGEKGNETVWERFHNPKTIGGLGICRKCEKVGIHVSGRVSICKSCE